jgi:hypothetical protein
LNELHIPSTLINLYVIKSNKKCNLYFPSISFAFHRPTFKIHTKNIILNKDELKSNCYFPVEIRNDFQSDVEKPWLDFNHTNEVFIHKRISVYQRLSKCFLKRKTIQKELDIGHRPLLIKYFVVFLVFNNLN